MGWIPSFINALFCFSSVHGTSRFFRADQGTNFVWACNELAHINLGKVSPSISEKNITWLMNPSNSSHHGGIWERHWFRQMSS